MFQMHSSIHSWMHTWMWYQTNLPSVFSLLLVLQLYTCVQWRTYRWMMQKNISGRDTIYKFPSSSSYLMHIKYSKYCLTLSCTAKKIKFFNHLRLSEWTTIASSHFNFCSIVQIYFDTIQFCNITENTSLKHTRFFHETQNEKLVYKSCFYHAIHWMLMLPSNHIWIKCEW